MTDEEIIALYASGRQQEAFNCIVRKYSERLYWHVRSLVVSHTDADDVLQEVFIKIWTSFSSFRKESGLYTWLWRIATNESLNFLRYNKVRRAFSLSSVDETSDAFLESDPMFDGDKAHRLLTSAISKLPLKQRAVFCMRYYEDMSYEDIAAVTGTSVGALKASYHFACEKIRKSVEIDF